MNRTEKGCMVSNVGEGRLVSVQGRWQRLIASETVEAPTICVLCLWLLT